MAKHLIQLHRINELDQHFAPGVIQGPYTKDSQEHHEWEDAETIRRQIAQRDGFTVLIKWARVTVVIASLAALAGWMHDMGADKHVAQLFGRAK